MDDHEQAIRDGALARLAKVFNLPISDLGRDMRFDVELIPSCTSDFRRNEFDQIDDDIHDVADRSIMKELKSGRLTIRTVGDYCEHMVRCSKVKPEDVDQVLRAS